MKKSILAILQILVVALVSGAALAQTGSGASSGSAAGSAAPTLEPAVAPAPPAPPTPAQLRKTCTDAMNADPAFASSIIQQAKEMNCTDAAVLKAHEDAQEHIRKNERHVILGYAAMWVIAAAFVLYLWRRQQALKAEILQLRRDLETATKDGK